MDMPMGYHVWDATCSLCWKLTNTTLNWNIVFSTIRNNLLHDIIDKAIVLFSNIIRSRVAATGGQWHCEHICLKAEWAVAAGIHHWNIWTVDKKLCKIWFVIREHSMCKLHVHLKKWTLKFKLLYLRHVSYFDKICRIFCMNIHIHTLKVWLKSILLWLKYRFFKGIVFIGVP